MGQIAIGDHGLQNQRDKIIPKTIYSTNIVLYSFYCSNVIVFMSDILQINVIDQ